MSDQDDDNGDLIVRKNGNDDVRSRATTTTTPGEHPTAPRRAAAASATPPPAVPYDEGGGAGEASSSKSSSSHSNGEGGRGGRVGFIGSTGSAGTGAAAAAAASEVENGGVAAGGFDAHDGDGGSGDVDWAKVRRQASKTTTTTTTTTTTVAAEDILLRQQDEEELRTSPVSAASPSTSCTSRSRSLLNREETRTLQWATTGLGILFAAVVALTVLAMDQYRLVVLVGLLMIIGSFYLLLRVVQHVADHPGVLPPVVHGWVQAVRSEYRSFVADWREHVLLLTYQEDDPEESMYQSADGDGDAAPPPHGTASRRPRSRIFRALVQPLAPWLSRRKERLRRNKRRGSQHEVTEDQDDKGPSVELPPQPRRGGGGRGLLDGRAWYVPPGSALV